MYTTNEILLNYSSAIITTTDHETAIHSDSNYFSYIYRIYIVGFIMICSLCGNLMSIIVFIAGRKNKNVKTSSRYLLPLAIFDFANSMELLVYWLSNGALYLFDYATSPVACFFHFYFGSLFMYLSGFTIVVFSFERLIAVWFPIKIKKILTTRTRYIIRGTILLVGCLSFLISLNHATLGTMPDETFDREFVECIRSFDITTFLGIISLFIVYVLPGVLPCLLVVIANIFIYIGIKRGVKNRDKLTLKTSNSELRTTVTLFLISIIYVVTILPFYVIWFWAFNIPRFGYEVPNIVYTLAISLIAGYT